MFDKIFDLFLKIWAFLWIAVTGSALLALAVVCLALMVGICFAAAFILANIFHIIIPLPVWLWTIIMFLLVTTSVISSLKSRGYYPRIAWFPAFMLGYFIGHRHD